MSNELPSDAERAIEIPRERIRDRVRDAIEGECVVIYDAFPYDGRGIPIDNLDRVAVAGRARVEDDIWDSYTGEVLENPTWLQLAVEANRIILASGDRHHVFFENIEVMRITDDGVQVLSLDLGS